MAKRNRNDNPSWWTIVAEEIRSNRGFLHSNLAFSANRRELHAIDKFDADELLMRIPKACLVSHERCLSLAPWLNQIQEKMPCTKLHSPLPDIIMALSMSASSSTTLPYLATLPDPSTFDALPRRWNDNQINHLLKGSPLLERVKNTQRGVLKDYEIARDIWKELKIDLCFPAFDKFSDMLAAVSSRAFIFGETDADVTMIPILDLGDHSRGKDSRKNVCYKRIDDGAIEVRSACLIERDGLLRLTYGARGNAQLLLNYGFTIPRNHEPDGSSNDVLELSLDGTSLVDLRTGPKSYSYGGFVKVLEQAYESPLDTPNDGTTENQKDDMEAFLNECEGPADDDIDLYGDSACVEEGGNDGGDTVDNEIEALTALEEALRKKIEAYALDGTKLKDILGNPKPSPDYFSALLIQSEKRTIYFFVRVAEKIRYLLQNRDAQCPPGWLESNVSIDDLNLIETQTKQLAAAFMKIRHGGL